jgi:predicted permease
MLAVTDPFLMRPLPYRAAHQLAVLQVDRLPGGPGQPMNSSRTPTFEELRSRSDLFQDLAAYGDLDRLRFPGINGAIVYKARRVSPGFLTLLGIDLTLAPDLAPAPRGAPQPLLLPRREGSAADGIVVGRTLAKDERGNAFELDPILPAEFVFPHPRVSFRPDALIPSSFALIGEAGRSQWVGIARLVPGVTPSQVKTALQAQLARAGFRLQVESLSAVMAADVRAQAQGALVCGLVIALICIANVASLMVSRGVYRAPDFATQVSLGARSSDLMRVIWLETALLSAAGVAVALAIAHAVLSGVAAVIPEQHVALGEPELTWRAAIALAGLGAAAAAICAAASWFAVRSSVTMFERVHAPEPRGIRRIRAAAIATQTAFAMVLVVAGTLLLGSHANLWLQHTGYRGDVRLVTVSYIGSSARPSSETIAETVTALKRVPGVTAAAASRGVGALHDSMNALGGHSYQVDGRVLGLVPTSEVTADFFEVVGTRILAGRSLRQTDIAWGGVVVTRAFAKVAWPGTHVSEIVARTVVVDKRPVAVVGVAEDVHDRALDLPPVMRVYKLLEAPRSSKLSYAVALNTPAPADAALRLAIVLVDPTVHVEGIDSIDGRLAESVRDRTFTALLLALFGGAALTVSTFGMFAAVAFVVARRTREIAIRATVGARPYDICRVVTQDAVLAAFGGMVAGLVVSRLAARALESLLYGIDAGDWSVPVLSGLFFSVVAGLAAWLPASRALRIDLSRALRTE